MLGSKWVGVIFFDTIGGQIYWLSVDESDIIIITIITNTRPAFNYCLIRLELVNIVVSSEGSDITALCVPLSPAPSLLFYPIG